jgi:aspartyl-tRNA(Asn)/glutamyl-tRNA(Gln) amidotransferase subunit A
MRKARPRLGIPTRYFTEDMDETVSRDFLGSVDALRSSGEFEVGDVPVGADYSRYSRARAIIMCREAAWFYEEILRSPNLRRTMHQDVRTLMGGGLRTGMIEYVHSMNLRADWIRKAPRLLNGLDALIMPTCLIIAPKVDEVIGKETGRIRSLLLRNAELFNLSGLPALSIPIRKTDGSMPTALQVVGRHGQDGLVLSIAEKIWETLRPR